MHTGVEGPGDPPAPGPPRTRWSDALRSKGLLADGFRTVALSYVGSDITPGVDYRSPTETTVPWPAS